MRVAFLAGQLTTQAFGVHQMIEGLSEALAAQGTEIRVFGMRDAAWSAGGDTAWRGGEPRTFRYYGPSNFAYMPGMAPALAEFDPDLLHLHGIWMYTSALAARWAGAKPGRTLVISPHGMLAPAALAYSPVKKRLVRLAFQDRCFARAAGYHATAPKEASDIGQALGDVPVVQIPLGVRETSAPRPDWTARARRIVSIGRLHPVKGYDRLVRAWAQVEAERPDWSLEIAGPDPVGHGAELRQLIGELGVTRAKIGPPRFGAERDALVAGSQLFALPSLTENFASTVPEALVCGTPVLASTGTPWQALEREGCGWWVAPEPDALAATLRSATAHPDLATMGAKGRAWALQTFGWGEIGTQMRAFYDRLHGPKV